jgi:NADH dehydrogenase (ubiquinone) flavoprotein 2
MEKAKAIIAKYPEGRERSAILPLFDIAQRQNNGWLSTPAIEHVAELLNLPYIRAYEVATFYTMFNLKPVGKHHIQICGTTPCWLRGADKIKSACQEALNIKCGETTSDGMFTLSEVECLGACVNAPMVQINDDYFEDLDAESMNMIITNLQEGKKIKVGSQIGRQCSAAAE